MAQLRCLFADGNRVRLAKGVLTLALVAGLAFVWTGHRAVVDAYTVGAERPAPVRFSGVDLTVSPSPIPDSPFTTVEGPDTRAVALGEVEQVDPEPAPVTVDGGEATLDGVVTGPEGPVSSAVVRIERHTSEGSATVDVTADALGRWSVTGLAGGRYRIRAFVPQRYTMTTSVVRFLGHDERLRLELIVGPVDASPQMAFAHRGDLYVGLTGTVAVTVTSRRVDAEGLVVVYGVAGQPVTLTAGSAVTITPGASTTDTDGVARFVVRCDQQGTWPATAEATGLTTSYVLPPCRPVPAPTPSPEAGPRSDPGGPADPGGEPEPGGAVVGPSLGRSGLPGPTSMVAVARG